MSKQVEYIISLANREGFDMSKYETYSIEQVVEIYRGLKEGVDVTVYDSSLYSSDRMYVIRECLNLGFPKPDRLKNYSDDEIKHILIECRFIKLIVDNDENFKVLIDYFLEGYSIKQLKIISKALEENLDIQPLSKVEYTELQMEQIYLMVKEGINSEPVADVTIDWHDMAIYRLKH